VREDYAQNPPGGNIYDAHVTWSLFGFPTPTSSTISERNCRQAAIEHGAILHSMQLSAVKDLFIDDADELVNRWDQSGRASM
jgi:hypothetical protein